VRVGDPNQAIYETFTTASPDFLRSFLEESDVQAKELPNSGRFAQSIMDLANELIKWTRADHPVPGARDALTPPYILPTPPGDPQPNPRDDPQALHLVDLAYTPQEELEAVAIALERWLADHPKKTVAVLVPRNYRGFELSEVLEQRGVPYLEILRSTKATRESAGALVSVLQHLIEPASTKTLGDAYRIWREANGRGADDATVEETMGQINACRDPESYLWPHPDRDWLSERVARLPTTVIRELEAFRIQVHRWHASILLPVDQMILTLAQDLFREAVDLAVSHKLAGVVKRIQDDNPGMGLPELVEELEKVAENERRFIGLDRDERAFDPDQHRGVVVVTTVHKAKGLEWDRVLLISVNDYDYPAALPEDHFISEKGYFKEGYNLEAETLAQLKMLAADRLKDSYRVGEASLQSRLDYASERLRLFYVGITRARHSLTVTWNSGRYGDAKQALAFKALQSFWEDRTNESAA
jgi:DNA helicase-2/ATP-dependent DNA helicase PcrA